MRSAIQSPTRDSAGTAIRLGSHGRAAGEFLHLDVTLIRSRDGMRALLHVVIPGRRPLLLTRGLRFAAFFFGTLQRIYLPEVSAALRTMFVTSSDNVRRR